MAKKKYAPPSRLAARVHKALLSSEFTVLTEVSVGERLTVDFVLRELNIGIEADGQQHEKFNSFHYDGKDDFRAAKARDQKKEVLCEKMGLKLIRLTEKEIMSSPGPEALMQLILQKAAEQTKEDEW